VAAIVEESKEESLNFVHPCSPHVQLNNWVSVNVSRVFNGNEIYVDESFENNNVNISYTNFTLPVNNTEDDYKEDWEPPPELLRLVEQEAREITTSRGDRGNQFRR